MRIRATAALVAASALALLPGPALAADELTISHVEPDGETVQILVSVSEGTSVDLDTPLVTIGSAPADASASLVSDGDIRVERTTILAIDTSDSMAEAGRFDAAKNAAQTFLDTVPEDVLVGIVTFDSDVEAPLQPTTDRAQAAAVIDGLELNRETRLNDGVLEAVELAGTEGQRSILVLSDGRDTSDTPLEDVTAAVSDAEVLLDVVALDQSGSALSPLRSMSEAGDGSVISADSEALAAAFDREADALARQVLVTATVPDSITSQEATIEVSLAGEGGTFSATTLAVVQDALSDLPVAAADPEAGIQIPKTVMFGGLAAMGVGILILATAMLSGLGGRRPETIEERIAAYAGGPGTADGGDAVAFNIEQAKDAAASMLHHNRSLEARIEARLEAAGSALKPAEWLLLHSAIAMVSALVGMLLGSGDIFMALLFLALGLVIPWAWLGIKKSRRIKAFNSGLADTLQLMAGSLTAGMSLSQSIDSVVNEGQEPIAGEFKRVLVETRLGVPLEPALEGIATRIGSKDFAWVVMAIRIQREVGGNLAELLTTVAGTLRERDYLRRQIKALSAEGRLSAYILGGMPPLIAGWLFMTRREYIMPMFTNPLGLAMLAAAVFLLGLGGFMMSRIVKVEI